MIEPQARTSWSAVIVGPPTADTMLIVDWLMLAAQIAGHTAHAIPLCGGARAPHGMFVEIAAPGVLLGAAIPQLAVDAVVAGEHTELARALEHGYADATRTTIVSSCQRDFSAAERGLAPARVLQERDVDRAAERSSASYVAFDARDVRSWYRLPHTAEPGLLLGALLGSGSLPLDRAVCEQAVEELGLHVRPSLAGLARGIRFGRRSGGRIKRTLTAAQFTRTRRGRLARSERAGFQQLIERVERELPLEHREVVREGVYLLCQHSSTEYAGDFLERCVLIEREERAAAVRIGAEVDPATSIVPMVARNLAAIMGYTDLAAVASVKLRPGRLPSLRRWHGVSRDTPYSVRELIPVDAYERAQLAPEWLRTRIDPTGSPLLCDSTVRSFDATTLRGALALRRMARSGARRAASPRHRLELDAADAYVGALRETLQQAPELASIVAESGAIVQGYGATRAASRVAGENFWGRVVRQALQIDRSSPDGVRHVSLLLVPRVYEDLARRGPLALWDVSAHVVGIALQQSRGVPYEHSLALVRQLLGIDPSPRAAAVPSPEAAYEPRPHHASVAGFSARGVLLREQA